MKCNGVISSVSMEVAHVYEVKCNKVTVFNFWFHILDLEVFGSVIAFLSQPILYIFPCMNYIGKISGRNWIFFRPTTAQDIREREQRILLSDWLISSVISLVNLLKVILRAGKNAKVRGSYGGVGQHFLSFRLIVWFCKKVLAFCGRGFVL